MAHLETARQLISLAEGLRDSAIGQAFEDPATGEDTDSVNEQMMDDAGNIDGLMSLIANGKIIEAQEHAHTLNTHLIRRIKYAAPLAYSLLFHYGPDDKTGFDTSDEEDE